jgi:hypothetical protein
MIGFMFNIPGRPAQVGPAHSEQPYILPKRGDFAYTKLRPALRAAFENFGVRELAPALFSMAARGTRFVD